MRRAGSPRGYEDAVDARARELATAAQHSEAALQATRWRYLAIAHTHRCRRRSCHAAHAAGDFAFASAVAAFGQKLRGDALLDGFTYPQLVSLAGPQTDFWRQEFLQLVKTADGLE